MAPKKAMPTFNTEADEARWYAEHQDELEDYMDKATPEQVATVKSQLTNLKRTAPEKLAALAERRSEKRTEPVTIRLGITDLTIARALGDLRGIGYQTVIKMLLHQALQAEAASSKLPLPVVLPPTPGANSAGGTL